MNEVIAEVENMYKQFRLSEALKTIYSLIWDDFCSWYLEWVKPGFEKSINENVYSQTVDFFERLLQLLHPFMPFITEEIYHLLKESRKMILTVKQFEGSEKVIPKILNNAFLLKEDITAIRDARKKNEIKNNETINFMGNAAVDFIYLNNRDLLALLQKQTKY